MNKARLLAVAFVTFASVPPMMAQRVNATAEQNASASARNANVDESANANPNAGHVDMNGAVESSMNASGGRADASAYSMGAASAELRPVKGELENRLDSKTAKPGDKVILKTSEKMRTSDGTEIPKGSRLVGHVTEVRAHEKGHAESHLGLEFDRADLRGGQSMAIHSMIESLQPSASAVAAGTIDNEEAFATPMSGGGGSMGGGRIGSGGLLGGAAGGAATATGSLGSDLGSTAGSAMRATGDASGSAVANLGRGLNGAAGGTAAPGAHATGIQGVMLNGEAAGSASGMLSAANKNIHLDSGTQMVLGVAAAR